MINEKSEEEIWRTVTELKKMRKGIGLIVHSEKTKYMSMKREISDHNCLRVGSNIFELVNEFKYLATILNS